MDITRPVAAAPDHRDPCWMLGPDDLIDCESDADQIMRLASVHPEAPVHPRELAANLEIQIERSYGARLSHRREADIVRNGSTWTIHLLMKLSEEREAWILGHEIGHWYYRTCGRRPEREEARCDAIGACLVAPRPAFAEAAKILGHRVHELADAFHTTQSLALLRLGEVTGRPVLLFRPFTNIIRGELFEWGHDPRSLPRNVAHPIKVDRGLGMMVERGWQEAA